MKSKGILSCGKPVLTAISDHNAKVWLRDSKVALHFFGERVVPRLESVPEMCVGGNLFERIH